MIDKYHASFNVPRQEQGLIYYTCLNQKLLPPKKQIYILNLCIKIGGEYAEALLETLTSDLPMVGTAKKHYMDVSTLYRLTKKFYEAFDVTRFENDKKEQDA